MVITLSGEEIAKIVAKALEEEFTQVKSAGFKGVWAECLEEGDEQGDWRLRQLRDIQMCFRFETMRNEDSPIK